MIIKYFDKQKCQNNAFKYGNVISVEFCEFIFTSKYFKNLTKNTLEVIFDGNENLLTML